MANNISAPPPDSLDFTFGLELAENVVQAASPVEALAAAVALLRFATNCTVAGILDDDGLLVSSPSAASFPEGWLAAVTAAPSVSARWLADWPPCTVRVGLY